MTITMNQTGTTTDKIILNQGSRLYVVFRLLNENQNLLHLVEMLLSMKTMMVVL